MQRLPLPMIRFPVAKVNLGLNVIRRRPDGYHDLETVFCPVPDLTDALEILPASGPQATLREYGPQATECPMERNLVYRAWALLRKEYGIQGVTIHLVKRIPSQAGLGGGSSDASCALSMLNELFHLDLDPEALRHLALRLGADCPFFIQPRASFAQGVGERLSPVSLDLCAYRMVIVKPELSVSTREAFEGIRPSRPLRSCLDVVTGMPPGQWNDHLENDFEKTIFALHPELRLVKEALYLKGALYASMSGSGSALYGLFPKEGLPSDLSALKNLGAVFTSRLDTWTRP